LSWAKYKPGLSELEIMLAYLATIRIISDHVKKLKKFLTGFSERAESEAGC
jgi:hypothetical protein